jgi:hypothetical protein
MAEVPFPQHHDMVEALARRDSRSQANCGFSAVSSFIEEKYSPDGLTPRQPDGSIEFKEPSRPGAGWTARLTEQQQPQNNYESDDAKGTFGRQVPAADEKIDLAVLYQST